MDLPNEDALRWIVSRYAALRAGHADAFTNAALVLPTGEFFPDEFSASPEGIATLLRRTLAYAPVADDLDLELAFLQAPEKEGGGSCSSGACGTGGGAEVPLGHAVETESGYRVSVRVTDVGNPTLLTASLARSAGGIVLAEADDGRGPVMRDAHAGPASEIAAVACGFGLLLANGACVYTKSCGGLRAHQGTFLGIEEVSVALALFLRVHDIKPGRARAHMETTQREAFDLALAWVDGNAALVRSLRDQPELLADGIFSIKPPAGFFGRLFGRKRDAAIPSDAELEAVLASGKSGARKNGKTSASTPKSEAELRRIAETRALVEQALRGE